MHAADAVFEVERCIGSAPAVVTGTRCRPDNRVIEKLDTKL